MMSALPRTVQDFCQVVSAVRSVRSYIGLHGFLLGDVRTPQNCTSFLPHCFHSHHCSMFIPTRGRLHPLHPTYTTSFSPFRIVQILQFENVEADTQRISLSTHRKDRLSIFSHLFFVKILTSAMIRFNFFKLNREPFEVYEWKRQKKR